MVNGRSSRTHRVDRSVPQGSCLGPVESITYTESVASVIGRHKINQHVFADDEQVYASTPLEGVDDVRGRLHHRRQQLVRVPSAPTQREQDRACLVR